jgi:hypothetical protein
MGAGGTPRVGCAGRALTIASRMDFTIHHATTARKIIV